MQQNCELSHKMGIVRPGKVRYNRNAVPEALSRPARSIPFFFCGNSSARKRSRVHPDGLRTIPPGMPPAACRFVWLIIAYGWSVLPWFYSITPPIPSIVSRWARLPRARRCACAWRSAAPSSRSASPCACGTAGSSASRCARWAPGTASAITRCRWPSARSRACTGIASRPSPAARPRCSARRTTPAAARGAWAARWISRSASTIPTTARRTGWPTA